MSPRARVWGVCRTLAVRTRPVVTHKSNPFISSTVCRVYSADTNSQRTITTGNAPKDKAPNNANAAISEANASVTSSSQSMAGNAAEQTSEFSDSSHIETLDDATLEQIFYGGRPTTSAREGGLTAAQEEALYREGTIPPPAQAEALIAEGSVTESSKLSTSEIGDIQNPGHKFGLPKKPYPEGFNMKQRYHPVLEQLTRLLMRDGKLSVAQRNVAMVMNFLRTAPAPIYSPKFPLLPGTPPASHLPLNPVLYITIAIDSVAPLLKVRNIAGAGGGGRALELPVPLAVRQRRRMAIKWVLDVIEKKPSKGSGKKQFPHRIAEEIIAVVEGRSGVWEKRKQVHKLGTAARANVGSRKLRVKKKM
ncbi:hypothetical protein QQS21_011454 [Conoideocrella luteorostrata]|uniref:Small ribosomal subunit protein uS7m n=1 Tax=Conoideocrella luteorostrata TaxID=1105319 RepID=A0AAJ0FNJ7_9HYPO|nr:hypothetical protein QQS21_011454 [Conoideocrella luteorostrata]